MDPTNLLPQTGVVTLLMTACQRGNLTSVQEILSSADASLMLATDRNQRSALHYCAEYNQQECADYILNAIADPKAKSRLLDLQDNAGFTPLIIAAINDHLSMVHLLITHGAGLDNQDKDGHTACHWATVCNHLDCLDELLQAKANPSFPDIHGAYPLHYAAQMSAEKLTSKPSSPAPGSTVDLEPPGLRFVKRLTQEKVAVNCLDNDQRTPLLWASSSGADQACKLLFEAGADVNLPDKDGLTAVHCAASLGHLKCLQVLVDECNADPDAKDRHGCTPFMYAATLGYLDCIRFLGQKGVELNHQDKKGRSAAHLAAAKGQTESIMEVEDLGGDIWMKNHRGDYPLHEAALAGFIGLIEFLLSKAPRAVNFVNRSGRSCLHIAAMRGDMPLCQFLLDNGINVNTIMRNSKNQYFTALDLANAKNNAAMIKTLRQYGAAAAAKLTKTAASKIQQAFKRAQSKRGSSETKDDEVILENGVTLIGSLEPTYDPSREKKVSVKFEAYEADPNLVPHLPNEIVFEPDHIQEMVAKEVHSDVDAIMDASVLSADTSPIIVPPAQKPNHFFSGLYAPSGYSSASSKPTTPVFEMSTLSLLEVSPAHSVAPSVKYESDSDDDMKHPEIRKSTFSLDEDSDDGEYQSFTIQNPFPTSEDDLIVNAVRPLASSKSENNLLMERRSSLILSRSNKSALVISVDRPTPKLGDLKPPTEEGADGDILAPAISVDADPVSPSRKFGVFVSHQPIYAETEVQTDNESPRKKPAEKQYVDTGVSTNDEVEPPREKQYRDSADSARYPPSLDFHAQTDSSVVDSTGVQTSARSPHNTARSNPVSMNQNLLPTVTDVESDAEQATHSKQPTEPGSAEPRQARLTWGKAAENEPLNPVAVKRKGILVSAGSSIRGSFDKEPRRVSIPDALGVLADTPREDLYKKFRPPTPKVPNMQEIRRLPPVKKAEPFEDAWQKARTAALLAQTAKLLSQHDKDASLDDSNQKLSVRSRGVKVFEKKFNDTVSEIRPYNVTMKYLQQFDAMKKKDVKYNEAVVLARIIPKYIQEMKDAGRVQWTKTPEKLTSELRTFKAWEVFLAEELQNVSKQPSRANGGSPTLHARTNGSQSRVSSSTSSVQPRIALTHSKSRSGSGSTEGRSTATMISTKRDALDSEQPSSSSNSPAILKAPTSAESRGSVGSVVRDPSVGKKKKTALGNGIVHPFPWR